MCANNHIGRYRYALFLICGKSVSGCQNIMDSEAFSDFTNQVVRLSNASHDEQKILFGGINKKLEATPSNTVEVAFGEDGDFDGDLAHHEIDLIVGCECGQW